jgi:hypothetical protein
MQPPANAFVCICQIDLNEPPTLGHALSYFHAIAPQCPTNRGTGVASGFSLPADASLPSWVMALDADGDEP